MSNQINENSEYTPPKFNNISNINNNTETRRRSKNIKNANKKVLDEFREFYDPFDELGDKIKSDYDKAKNDLDSFIESIEITLNPDQNNKESIIVQYTKLNEYKVGYDQLISNNKVSLNDILSTLKKISTLVNKITNKINLNDMSNKGIRDLQSIKDDIIETKIDIEKFYNLYQKLGLKITNNFNAKYSELKNNIKDALIGFYGKQFNSQFNSKKINNNYLSITNETPDTKKVEILINIKTKIDDLNKFYLESVDIIKENIKTKDNNSNLKTYQDKISIKIDGLYNELNKKIDNIKKVTSDDIDQLKKDVSLIIEQIRNLINTYSSKHNFSKANTESALKKLNELALLNKFSIINLNKAVDPIIKKLNYIITGVESNQINIPESNTGTVTGTGVGTQINAPEENPNTTPVSNYNKGLGNNLAVSGLIPNQNISWSSGTGETKFKAKYNDSRKNNISVLKKKLIPVKNVEVFYKNGSPAEIRDGKPVNYARNPITIPEFVKPNAINFSLKEKQN